jgi:aspartyl-tRNA(Asn)/glutamyl-tRNA(Gln) amidotransferase subunit C
MPAQSPSIGLDEVRRLAALARIELDEAHVSVLAGQLDVILHAVAQVSQVAGEHVPPTSHPLPLTNVFRADQVRPSLSAAEALSAAPAVEAGRFRVPRILDEDT